MPHRPDDQRHLHIRLRAEEPNPERRKQTVVPQPPPNRGGRAQFAGELESQLASIEATAAARPAPPAGIEPHLVFRIPLAKKASPVIVSEMLQRLGIMVVAIDPDGAIIAFRDDSNLEEFHQAVASYRDGPSINPKSGELYKSTQWDVLEYIEAQTMRIWGRTDRIGRRLESLIGEEAASLIDDKVYILDVELWHRGTRTLATEAIAEIQMVIDASDFPDQSITDSFIGQFLCLARLKIRGTTLSDLLNLDVIAEVETPPQPVFDPRIAAQSTSRDFPKPPKPLTGGPSVCILDSGITSNHPLLQNNVGHAESILTNTDSTADGDGHGTMVGGLAVYGDVRDSFDKGSFQSPITLYSARVLNEQNRFDEESLIIVQMRTAIETFVQEPYNCRVFNVSLGAGEPWLRDNPRQSVWAESLDILAREFNIVIVVSAGNQNLGWTRSAEEAEEILDGYPDFLFDDECGLCEPATAAIPIVVGGVANHDVPEVSQGMRKEDLVLVIAQRGEPSPLSRIGPGINEAVKPEFVAPSGNFSFQGMRDLRVVEEDTALAVMSLSNTPTESLFAFDAGTSFAAPVVARSAALLWHHLNSELDEEPQANLVRALLASSSQVDEQTHRLIHGEHGEEGVRRVCGYGVIDDDLAMESADRRVTLFAQGIIPIDTFSVYEIPAPKEFRAANGRKRVIVSLAYDPPVRRRRSEYLGVRVDYSLFRGKSLGEVVEAYRALSTEERQAAKDEDRDLPAAFKSPYRCDLKPGPKALKNSTLMRSEWTFTREGSDYGESWYVVVRASRVWAPAIIFEQSFGLTVTLEADEPRLYNLVRQRVQIREGQRVRTRQ